MADWNARLAVSCSALLGGGPDGETRRLLLNELKLGLGHLNIAPRRLAWLDEEGCFWLDGEHRDNCASSLRVRARRDADCVVDDEADLIGTPAREEVIVNLVGYGHVAA